MHTWLSAQRLTSEYMCSKCASDVLRNSGNNKALDFPQERELNSTGCRFGTRLEETPAVQNSGWWFDVCYFIPVFKKYRYY